MRGCTSDERWRYFGVNPEPLGGNIRDEWVQVGAEVCTQGPNPSEVRTIDACNALR